MTSVARPPERDGSARRGSEAHPCDTAAPSPSSPLLALVLLPGSSRPRRRRASAGDPAARAPAAGLRARGVGEPERRLVLPVRQGRRRARASAGSRRAPDGFPLTIRVPFPWGSKLSGVGDEADVAWYARTVRVPRGLEGQAGLPRGRRLRLEDERVARRRADRRVPGGLHALRAGAHEGREARAGPEARPARGRHAAPVQARGQAGLRQGARAVADRLPRGAARRSTWSRSSSTRTSALKRVEARVRLSRPGARGSGRRAAGPHRRRRATRPSRRRRRSSPSGAREARLTLPLGEQPAAVVARGPASSTTRRSRSRRRRRRGPREDRTSACARSASRALPGLGHPYVSLNGKPVYLQMTLDQSLAPRRLLHLADRRGDARGDPDRAAAGPQRDPHARQGRGAAQALLGRPARACWS